ncbi:MAG: endonuclease/exonuclease/phosphatase family protein [Paludibacter sp.]
MKKLFYTFALVAFTLISCEKNEIDKNLIKQQQEGLIANEENRNSRPIILGEKINNPYSLKNMIAALDTLKKHPDQHSSCLKAPSSSLDEIVIEPTDLYVRILPTDSIQFLQLMSDSTLILFDYPLDYQKEQTGDYYNDPSLSGKYTWLYTTVPIGYQSTNGINFEIIEELFIPQHSPYYSEEKAPDNVKGIMKAKASVESKSNYMDVLKTIEAISFINTGNSSQLNKPTETSQSLGKQKSTSYVTKRFLWSTWREAVYNPEGYISVYTRYGMSKPLANIRIRVARYFTFFETRTDANGRFYFNDQFGQDAVFPNIEYFVYFDGKNGSNYWKLYNLLGGTSYTSLGVHSPDNYSMTFSPSSDNWGKCIQHYAINNYMDIARKDGICLPATELNIDPINSSTYTQYEKLLTTNISGGSYPDLVLNYQNTYDEFYKMLIYTWYKLSNASIANKLLSIYGKYGAENYWNAVQDQLKSDDSEGLNDCFCITHKQQGDCSHRIALTQGWANYRLNEIYQQIFTGSTVSVTQNQYLIQYITMFRNLRSLGCSNQSIETAICSNTILEFRNKLISYYPNLTQQIKSIVTDPDEIVQGNITLITYNLLRTKGTNLQSNRIPALARIISTINPDVVAIQETYDGSLNENLEKLKSLTGLDGYRFMTYNEYPIGNFGEGMLWKSSLGNPIITTKVLKPSGIISSGENKIDGEDRVFIAAEFPDFYFICTHFSAWTIVDRKRMADAINEFVSSLNKPVFMGGDFNSGPETEEIKKLTNNGFTLLNDFNNLQGASPIDMLMLRNNTSTSYSIVSRGVPYFPHGILQDLEKSSDHIPYFVSLNKTN